MKLSQEKEVCMKREVWIPLLALALAAVPAAASTFLYQSQAELVAQAEAVVQGRIVEVHSFWNAEHTAILTEATLEVEDAVVGAAPTYVNLRTFGGRVAPSPAWLRPSPATTPSVPRARAPGRSTTPTS
jgi:hypothetical protein